MFSYILFSSYAWAIHNDSIEVNDSVRAEEQQFLNHIDSMMNIWYIKHSVSMYTDYESLDSAIDEIPVFTDSVYIRRLQNLPAIIPMTYNDKVKSYIDLYTLKRRKSVEIMLGLSEYYFPLFESMLDAEGLPLELKYLPVIESALNPRAVSRMGATGLWQFMYHTAKLYKLEVNSLVDERRDPQKSTEAAIKYLKNMYEVYQDWYLTIASYNCGPGNVNKAIRRSGGSMDFWEIYTYLPRETRGYVPAFIAATYVMYYYDFHRLNPRKVVLPLMTDTIMIDQKLHLKQVAEVLDIPVEQLRDMNPQYRKDIVPGGDKKYPLLIPANMTNVFLDNEETIYHYKDSVFFDPYKNVIKTPVSRDAYVPDPPGDNMAAINYTIKSGDNLGYISSWFHVKTADLRYWNNIRGNLIRAGQKLVIYVPDSKASYYKKFTSMSFEDKQKSIGKTVAAKKTSPTNITASNSDNYVYYTVKSGDSPWTIAKKFQGVSESDIMSLNNIKDPKSIKPGQKLKIKRK